MLSFHLRTPPMPLHATLAYLVVFELCIFSSNVANPILVHDVLILGANCFLLHRDLSCALATTENLEEEEELSIAPTSTTPHSLRNQRLERGSWRPVTFPTNLASSKMSYHYCSPFRVLSPSRKLVAQGQGIPLPHQMRHCRELTHPLLHPQLTAMP